jgi:hypothetical protein
LIQVPDDAVQISPDGLTLTVTVTNAIVVDQIMFPGGTGNNLGMAGAPATTSFSVTFTKTPGTRRHVRPTSTDPLSPFDWAGEMWMATNSGTFSVAYNDGTFSAKGSFSSQGNFGEMGTERNGSFVRHEDLDKTAAAGIARPPGWQSRLIAQQPADEPMFRGLVPVKYLIH